MTSKMRNRAGDSLRRLVDLVSHRSGLVLAVMDDCSVTLPQVLLVSYVERCGSASHSDLSERSNVSAPAMSQMIERLVRQGLLRRTEDAADRRRKIIVVTPHARALLRKLEIARSSEYELGLVSVSPKIQARLALILEQVIGEVERGRPNEGAAPGRGKRFG